MTRSIIVGSIAALSLAAGGALAQTTDTPTAPTGDTTVQQANPPGFDSPGNRTGWGDATQPPGWSSNGQRTGWGDATQPPGWSKKALETPTTTTTTTTDPTLTTGSTVAESNTPRGFSSPGNRTGWGEGAQPPGWSNAQTGPGWAGGSTPPGQSKKR